MTILQISAPSIIGASFYDILFNPATEGFDKTYSIDIVNSAELNQAIYYDADNNKKLNLNGNIYDVESEFDVYAGAENIPLTAVLRSTDGTPFYLRASSNDNSTTGRLCIGPASSARGGFVVSSGSASSVYNTEKTGLSVDMLIQFEFPSTFPSSTLILKGGLTNPTFTYSCTREDSTGFSVNIVARTPITDLDGIVYTKKIVIDNMDGSAVEEYDITSNVTFDFYQESSIVVDSITGKSFIDPENAVNLIAPNERYYDGFTWFISSASSTIDFGGYITQGGSPDNYLAMNDMTRGVAKSTKQPSRKVRSNLANGFAIAKQQEAHLQALKTLLM